MTSNAKSIAKISAITVFVVGLIGLMFGLTIAQETPSGTVHGRVLNENKKPIARARITLSLENEYQPTMHGVTDKDGYYVITDVAVGKYTGYASARGYETSYISASDEESGFIIVKEGKTTSLKDIQMTPRQPQIYGGISPTFLPGEKVFIELNGYSRKVTTQVRVRVYSYDFAKRVRARGGKEEPYDDSLVKWKNIGVPLYERTVTVHTDSEGYFKRNMILPAKDCGGYLVDVQLETTERLFKTLITDLALVTKRAPGKTLVYATSFADKKPLAGVSLEFYSQLGKLAVTGTTDSDGLFISDALPKDSLTVLGTSGASYAIANSYGIDAGETAKCYIYTDRPIYRPGHTVYFKGILRDSSPGRLMPVVNLSLPVKISDPDGNTVKTLSLQTNRYGTFNGQIVMDPETKPGYYSISASYKGESYERNFLVEEYRKPEFKASVSFSKPRYIGGSKIEANIEAAYYFGGAVAGAKVTYTVYKAQDYFYYYPEGDSDSSFYEELYSGDEGDGGYYDGYGEVALEGEGQTDENGVLKIAIPTKHSDEEERYTVEATVTDASGRSIDMSGGVMVTPGLFFISAVTDNYIYKPGQVVKTNVYTVDYDRKPIGNVNGTASVYRVINYEKNERELVASGQVLVGVNGRGEFSFTPKVNGSYQIEISATDRLGNRIMGDNWVYVASDEYEGRGQEAAALEVKVDKKLYKLGETARVMISSPIKDCYVLFTIEGKRLFSQQVIHLTSTTKVIEVPLPQDYVPNVYASATLVNGKKLATAEAPIPISQTENFLNVKIQSNKKRYLPGETATYTITTTNKAGKGVPAEVSLGVVDESLYAIREDTTPDIKKFFHGAVSNNVSTAASFYDDYYGGEDKFQGKVRKYFPDTAYWNPSIVTNASGVASVSFKLPDNLTTWRATARAVTEGTAVGSAKQTMVVTKNILVRLQTPRFFRQRDNLTLSAVVHNYTERSQNVRVWLGATGIGITGEKSRTVTIAPNGTARVEWGARPDIPGKATITVYAQGQGDQDAMQMEVPVLPHGVPEYVTVAGQTKTSTEFVLTVPSDIIANASSIDLGLSSSIAGAALGITDALKDYQMNSPEGIMDILLPNVVMYQALNKLGVATPEQYTTLQKMVKHDLKTVYAWQLPGGGWSWSEYGEKDEWMTAYVVYGLIRARQAGFAIDQEVLDKGIQATLDGLPNVTDLGKRATLIYVLALAGRAKPEWVQPVLSDPKLQNYSTALMILSLNEMGQPDKARALVPKLIKGAVQTLTHCSWPESFPWGFYSCNQYETTAYAVRAILAVDPQNPCIAKGIRWLVDRRRGDRYNANYDTASVVYALADYLKVNKPPVPNYDLAIYLNGKPMRNVTMGPDSLSRPETRITIPANVIHKGRNTIKLAKTGPGDLFYWASLRYYSTIEDVPAKSGKISISREYFRLKLVKDPKEGLVYKPVPLGGTASVCELIRCRLTLRSPKNFQYLTIDDMLPSGCEVVQRSRQSSDEYGWDYWWGGETVYDDHITFLVDYIHQGKRTIEYDFRPEIKGELHVMPAIARGAYEPDVYAHSAENRLVIR